MFFRLRRAINRVWFDQVSREVLATPPRRCEDNSFTLVSMLPHGELIMYLLAVKSFVHQLGRMPKIVALDDGTLSQADKDLLRRHMPDIHIENIADISTGRCPTRNCWERLMLVCDLSQTSYVVQIDSDTLSCAPVEEVAECIRQNRSFTLLGDRSFPIPETLDKAWLRLRSSTSDQVQAVVERSFNRLPEKADLNYIRGNAGFVGYARGSLSREYLTVLSEQMRSLVGKRWDDWGSEQVTSNLAIANSCNPLSLPTPKYVSYWAHPEIDYEQSAFIHFIGPFRYANGMYRKLAVRAIAQLPR